MAQVSCSGSDRANQLPLRRKGWELTKNVVGGVLQVDAVELLRYYDDTVSHVMW